MGTIWVVVVAHLVPRSGDGAVTGQLYPANGSTIQVVVHIVQWYALGAYLVPWCVGVVDSTLPSVTCIMLCLSMGTIWVVVVAHLVPGSGDGAVTGQRYPVNGSATQWLQHFAVLGVSLTHNNVLGHGRTLFHIVVEDVAVMPFIPTIHGYVPFRG